MVGKKNEVGVNGGEVGVTSSHHSTMMKTMGSTVTMGVEGVVGVELSTNRQIRHLGN